MVGGGGRGRVSKTAVKREKTLVCKDKIKRGGFFTVSPKSDYSAPRSYDPHCSSLGYGM